jgi:hypothetical protein
VYAGVDPLTHRRHYLLELASTRAEAELVRTGPYLDRLPLGDRCADVVGVLDAGRYARNETLREGSVALPTEHFVPSQTERGVPLRPVLP